jgi:hypothetical protein
MLVENQRQGICTIVNGPIVIGVGPTIAIGIGTT